MNIEFNDYTLNACCFDAAKGQIMISVESPHGDNINLVLPVAIAEAFVDIIEKAVDVVHGYEEP